MEKPFSAKISLLATIPFVLIMLLWFITSGIIDKIPDLIQNLIVVTAVLSQFILLGIGWKFEFPRWSLPAIGFCISFSIFLMFVSVPPLSGKVVLGLWGLLPITITMIFSVSFNFSTRPLKKLLKIFKDDSCLVLWTISGFIPLFVMIICDEIYGNDILICIIIETVMIVFGSFLYLNLSKANYGKISLTLSSILSIVIAFIFAMNQ